MTPAFPAGAAGPAPGVIDRLLSRQPFPVGSGGAAEGGRGSRGGNATQGWEQEYKGSHARFPVSRVHSFERALWT